MTLDIQFNLKSNPLYVNYLHENSYWYKILTREPSLFNDFIKEAKKYYQIRPSDRLDKALNTISLVQNVLATLK